MDEFFRPAWVEINLDNLIYNARQIKNKVGDRDIIGVVKADAYGHGAVEVASTLLKNGFTKLAVAILDEAIELRKNGIECPIMILGITPNFLFEDLIKYNLEPTISSYDDANSLSKMAVKYGRKIKIHIALDTGMGRIGFLPDDEGIDAVYKISQLQNIEIESLFSHFSTADESDKTYTKLQFEEYKKFYGKLMDKNVKINMKNIANSAAIMELPFTYFDEVRPGIIIYGYYPSNEVDKNKLNIKPVMTLKANIVHLKTIDKDKYVGYGRKFKSVRKTVIATLPIGYADGYSRRLSQKSKIIINDKLAPVVGNICMDQCMVDVTDVGDVSVGDEVILIGEKGNLKFNADNIASILETINYEVLCMMSKRLPRVYIKDGKILKVKNYIV
ncbi:alanine racemase [Clostridium algifaecis]|uniref:Alanine racemase n=1 Tax=Clostridium algifaecis TaxID=1472040 RepID=A0ABS4KV66_9CLOT|nr:alanine racemase [Clostridium algifaecis]